jgi:catechol 2,3-dioxygenase-like lactoylglutathione lyase family enzyme
VVREANATQQYHTGMLYNRIDHVVLPVRSIDEAAEPFARLGLTLFPGTRHAGRGTRNRGFFVGEAANEFYVELLGIEDEAAARAAGLARYVDGAAEGRGLSTVVLRVADMEAAAESLDARGVRLEAETVHAPAGRVIGEVAALADPARAVVDLRAIQYPDDATIRYRRHAEAGLLRHTFPLKRLDHLAAVAPELEVATRYWTDVLGVPLHGEVRTPAMIIRQFKIGDAIVELLGPATPESPIAQRPAGLASMAAFEVDDLEAAVAAARAVGFTPSEPGTGALPGTRTATIPAGELAGLSMQLLQYI